jgi:hypothetical protein
VSAIGQNLLFTKPPHLKLKFFSLSAKLKKSKPKIKTDKANSKTAYAQKRRKAILTVSQKVDFV